MAQVRITHMLEYMQPLGLHMHPGLLWQLSGDQINKQPVHEHTLYKFRP